MKRFVALLIVSLSPLTSVAQTPPSPQPTEMKRLDFLAGQWQGQGWIIPGRGERHTFRQTENVQPSPGGGEVRFTIRLNEKGQWFEVGEFTRDGKTWQKFFEMTLDRVK